MTIETARTHRVRAQGYLRLVDRDPAREGGRSRMAVLAAGVSLLAVGLVVGSLSAPGAQAQTVWLGTNSSDWYDPGNWDNGVPIAFGTNAVISTSVPPTEVNGGVAGAAAVFVGEGGTGQLIVHNGAVLTNQGAQVGGSAVAGNGTLSVSGAGTHWNGSGFSTIGMLGTGSLLISDGAVFQDNGMRVGLNAGSTGTVTIGGPGSLLQTQQVFVGENGTGSIHVSNSGRVTSSGIALIGSQVGASGTVTLSGAGSSWVASNSVSIGIRTQGSLSISDGALFRVTGATRETRIGSNNGGDGTVTVSGGGSRMEVQILKVGEIQQGTLTVSNGGYLSSTDATVGQSVGSQGAVTVTGAGSLWQTRELEIGQSSTGTLNILAGGRVETSLAQPIYLGYNTPATGAMTVSGAGSTFAATANSVLVVGRNGTGTLTISDGGSVTTLSGILGSEATGRGTSTVSGAGSNWTLTNQLIVGGGGTGTLTIADGGRVTAPNGTFLGETVASNATLRINGSAGAGRGVLETRYLDAEPGTRLIEFDGGTVRATANEANFTRDFLAGDIQLLAGGAIIDTQGFAITASAALQGAGGLTKVGSGTLTLSGVSTYGGQTTVEGGRLIVNGSIANSAVTVLSGAALGGSGTVGLTTIRSGATISPGNSIGSLSVNGNLVLAPGSTYAAEIAGDGSSDRIAVSGSAMVGGSRLSVTALDPATSYVNGQRYTVLTAAGGVSGIASAVSQSAFLDVALEHEPNEIDLVVKIKNNAPGPSAGSGSGSSPTAPPAIFGTVAQTRNQLAAAGALDTLPQTGRALTLYNGLLMLDAPSARDAFTALSGEAHASARMVLIEDSRLLRGAMNDRLRSAFGSVNAAPMATMSYGFSADHAPSLTGPMPALSTERFAVWGQGHGAWGRTGGDGNAAKLTRRTGGFLIGADASVFDTLRIGVVAGYDRSTFDARSRFSSGESDNYHLGLYAGGRWGAFGLRAGASYTWHDIETSRRVAFTGFSDGLKGDYTAGTAQLFGEAGHRVDLGRVALEPFAGLAYVNLRTGGFRETGGAAALSARSDDTGVGYATLGLRASTSFELAGAATTLRGGLAWRHAFGDVDPKATLAFSGSSSFAVAGIPIARDAAVVEAGLDLALGHSAKLGLSYAGQLAAEAQDHSFKGMLSVMF